MARALQRSSPVLSSRHTGSRAFARPMRSIPGAATSAVVAVVLASAALSVAGCRTTGATDWFPRVPGTVWVYERITADGRSELVVKALGERRIPELDLRIFLVEETRSTEDVFDAVNPVGYLVEDGYLAQLSDLAYDGSGRLRALGGGQPMRILPVDPRPGMHWTQQMQVFGGAIHEAPRQWDAEVRAREPVEVPAGRFDEVVEVRTRLRDENGVVLARYRDVFARGVGLVHSVSFDRTGDPSRATELRLLRCRIGSP